MLTDQFFDGRAIARAVFVGEIKRTQALGIERRNLRMFSEPRQDVSHEVDDHFVHIDERDVSGEQLDRSR